VIHHAEARHGRRNALLGGGQRPASRFCGARRRQPRH
jgi:hypothetical protein